MHVNNVDRNNMLDQDLHLIYEKISVITLIPILLIIIFNLLVILISKRENLENYRNSNQNIFDVKLIK